MPIPLPDLDDRSYADLMVEARALIPALHPEWTNHNPSDPGIALVELLAWLAEMVLYRLNDIPDQNVVAFLELLNGPTWTLADEQSLDAAVHDTVLLLRERYRAAAAGDFEELALVTWPETAAARALGTAGQVQRARCVPRRNLEAPDPTAPAPGHVSLIVIPPSTDAAPKPDATLCQGLWAFLDERRLLTMRHHVVGPRYVNVTIGAEIVLRADALAEAALRQAYEQLAAFFHPLNGGADGAGWPFGRDVYASEVVALLNRLALVDHVEQVTLAAPGQKQRQQQAGNRVIAISLDADELVVVDLAGLVVIDSDRNRYRMKGKTIEYLGRQEASQ